MSNNLPSMPEITDAFLNELVGNIINDVEHQTENDNVHDERKQAYQSSQQPQSPPKTYNQQPLPTSTYTQSTTNNFRVQNSETNTSTAHSNHSKATSNFGSKTMQKWLNSNELTVHPVWIGNLPSNISTSDLRHFVESHIGRVTVSTHINNNNSTNNCNPHKTYAFVNLPTAEKQMLVITLLDNKTWNKCQLMVRANKPVRFQQSQFFGGGNSKISQQQFKRFQDMVVPAILNYDININSVENALQLSGINISELPNRVFGKQCTLIPNCQRQYCSFYHCEKEKELGKVISVLSMRNSAQINVKSTKCNNNWNLNVAHSRHTLLVAGLAQSKRQTIAEMFDVFGDIDTVMVHGNNMCYVRMKYAQDAQKIVRLFSGNRSGVCIDFAAYSNEHLKLKRESISEPLQQQKCGGNGYSQMCNGQSIAYQNQKRIGYYNGYGNGNGLNLNLRNAYSEVRQNNINGYEYYKNDNPTNKQ